MCVLLSRFSGFLRFLVSKVASFCAHPSHYIVNMAYAEAARAQMSALIKYRWLKFSTLPNANANDIATALLFRVQLD